jgi:hypothetical protein
MVSSHLSLDLPKLSLLFSSPIKISYAFIISLICATCFAHPIIVDLTNLITFDEEYRLWIYSYSLCYTLSHRSKQSRSLAADINLRNKLRNRWLLSYKIFQIRRNWTFMSHSNHLYFVLCRTSNNTLKTIHVCLSTRVGITFSKDYMLYWIQQIRVKFWSGRYGRLYMRHSQGILRPNMIVWFTGHQIFV